MTIEKARELRDRIVRRGWTWRGEPELRNGIWFVSYRLAGDDWILQAFAKDRELRSGQDEENFVAELESSIVLGMASSK